MKNPIVFNETWTANQKIVLFSAIFTVASWAGIYTPTSHNLDAEPTKEHKATPEK